MPKRKTDKEKKVYFSPKEWEIVCRRSEELKMRPGTYIRRIAVYGELKYYDVRKLNDVYVAFAKIGINLNQIATVVNSTDSVYQKDMEDILTEMKRLKNVVYN